MKGFERLDNWTQRMQGARQMLRMLADYGKLDIANFATKSNGKQVYARALYDWLVSDLTHIEAFLNGEEYRFINHQRDAKGRLIKCEVVLATELNK